MGLATVYRGLQVLIKKGLIHSRGHQTGEVLYNLVERDTYYLTCVYCVVTIRLNSCP